MSAYLRENLLGFLAIFLALSGGAYAVSSKASNADLATGAVDSRVLASGAVEGPDIHSAAVGPKKIKLDKLVKYLQTRVNETCPDGQSVQGILADGRLLCVEDEVGEGTITEITTGGGLTGGGTSGTVDLGLDPALVQRRVADDCPSDQAIGAVAQDGSVDCTDVGLGTVTSVGAGFGLTGGTISDSGTLSADPTVLQQRVTPGCGAGAAAQSVNANGTLNCATVDVTERSGYVQLNDNPSGSGTILSFGGVALRATCLPGGNAQVEIGSTGGPGASLNFQSQSTSSGLQAGQVTNGAFATVANTATNDLGRFNVTTSSGAQVDGTFLAWAIATTGGVDCVFTSSALTFAS